MQGSIRVRQELYYHGYNNPIFSRKNFLILNKCIYVVKINNKRKLKVYLKDYDSGIISQELAAKYLGITPRRFRQIHKMYRSTGSVPAIGVNIGRPKKEVPEEWKGIIKQEYEKFRQNALYQEKTIFARCKIIIVLNTYVFASGTIRRVGLYGFGVIIFQKPWH